MLLGAALALAAGCTFTPRDPPTPLCPLPAEFREPLRPETVRDNIRACLRIQKVRCPGDSALVQAGPTIEPNYLESLHAEFLYIPDAQAEGLVANRPCGPGIPFFQGWGRSREVRFMRNALEAGADTLRPQEVEISFTQFDTLEVRPNFVRYNVQYQIALEFLGRTDRYGARARWDLVADERGLWTLKEWEDIEPQTGAIGTLGVLRGERGECE